MEKIFLTVLNMTFTASFVIAAIIIARLFLKKTPKSISYILWAAAGFRLVFPFSIESVLSLIPFNSQPIPQDIITQAAPRIDTGIPAIDNTVSSILPMASQTAGTGVNFMQILLATGALIWLTGAAAMLIYSVISVFTLKRRINGVVLLEDNIYEANIKTPFVMGFFKPKIYVPADLPDDERDYIIMHERTHIRRNDNFIKLIAYFILSVHWFNPFAWAAFMLMSTDMEMSCDEHVLKDAGGKTKKAYSMSILSLAAERRTINIYPLAFGEGDTKRRIKNVLSFKKHSKIKIIISFAVVIALTAGLMVNQISADISQQTNLKFAADVLTYLDIISESDVSPDNITRQEIMRLIAKINSATPSYFIGNSSAAVQYCVERGIAEEEWAAESKKTVTFREAVKMLFTALGHTGYSDTIYMSKAAEKEIRLWGEHAEFTFKDTKEDAILTKNDAIMLSYNFFMSDYRLFEAVFNEDTGGYDNRIIADPVYANFKIKDIDSFIAGFINGAVTADDKNFRLASEFMIRLNIISEDDISDEDYITRQDMAFFIGATITGTPIWFYDEDSNRKYDDAILHCLENGIITDWDWIMVEGEKTVTLEEAVKMLLHALGYTAFHFQPDFGDLTDGDTSSSLISENLEFIKKAYQKEIRLLGEYAVFAFTDIDEDEILTKKDAIMLLYNFLMSDYNKLEMVWNGETGGYQMAWNKGAVVNRFGVFVAVPTASTVTVNGKAISFDSYNVDGSNYFKLRDLAYALNGTAKQFDVSEDWSQRTRVNIADLSEETFTVSYVIIVNPGEAYKEIGGEMADKGTNSITAFRSRKSLSGLDLGTVSYTVDGKEYEMRREFNLYEINGEEYYALRELAEALDFSVSYDSAKDIIAIDTSKPYTPDDSSVTP